MQSIEQFMEDNQVYELFETLLKQLVIHRPQEPLDFLIDKLSKPEGKRIFLMGPPGSSRKEHALALAEYFNWTCISIGDLLKKEVSKKSDYGKAIAEAQKTYEYPPDDIVIDLVKKQIMAYEKDNVSWIIEGFPRTKVQALSLQKIGVIPDKFILLDIKRSASITKVKNNLIAANTSLYGPELEDVANRALEEYDLHVAGVKSAFKGFVYEYEATDKSTGDVANDLARMLRIRFRSNAPRRPPRVILLGPPGSGRSTQAQIISYRYGLVHISSVNLLKDEIQRNPDKGKIISKCLDTGRKVPDDIVISLVEQRIKQSDCRVNGWVLDGFPQTEAQINFLNTLKIKPSLVCLFEQPEEECVRRLSNRRIDPQTGEFFNLEINKPPDEATLTRLAELPEDKEVVIKARYQQWAESIAFLEEAFKNTLLNVQADKNVEQITELVCDAIQNPIF